MVYGRRQPRTKNASFEFRRREELAALMRSQKMFQSHLEGQKGQLEGLISLEVLCALRTLSLSQPLVMMMRRAHTGRNHPLLSHLQQQISVRERARTSA
jgi:hypothetical protein